jgi:hypothetical protein
MADRCDDATPILTLSTQIRPPWRKMKPAAGQKMLQIPTPVILRQVSLIVTDERMVFGEDRPAKGARLATSPGMLRQADLPAG